jgi:hypothetical protein
VKRLVAQELTLSFVPDAEQRLWRTVMRRKYQVMRNRVRLQNRLEALLEEAHIRCRVSSRTYWASAPAACCRRSPTAKRILHERVRYEERGPAVSTEAKKVRARKMIRELRSLGYRVELLPAPSSNPA